MVSEPAGGRLHVELRVVEQELARRLEVLRRHALVDQDVQLADRLPQGEVRVVVRDRPDPDAEELPAARNVGDRQARPAVLDEILDVRVVPVVQAPLAPHLVHQQAVERAVLAEVRIGHHQRVEIVAGTGQVDGESDGDGRGDGVLVDQQQLAALDRARRRKRGALGPLGRKAIEDLPLDPFDETVRIASRHADERPGARVVLAVERPHVIQGQRSQPFLGPDGGRRVRMPGVQQRVQGLLAQLLVVAAAQGGHDGVGQEVPVADEVRLVEPRRDHQIAHDGEERLQVIAMHLPDQHRHLLVGLCAERGRPGIERFGDLLEAQRLGAAAPHHQRGQGVQAVLASRVVDRAGAKSDAQGHQRRVGRRQRDNLGPLRARSRRAAARRGDPAEGQKHGDGRPDAANRNVSSNRSQRRHCCPSWVRITTVRLVSAK